MHKPPSTPRNRPYLHDPSWTDVITAYAIALAIPVFLVAASYPLLSVISIIGIVSLAAMYRSVTTWVGDLLRRRTITIRFGRTARVTIARVQNEECQPSADCCPA